MAALQVELARTKAEAARKDTVIEQQAQELARMRHQMASRAASVPDDEPIYDSLTQDMESLGRQDNATIALQAIARGFVQRQRFARLKARALQQQYLVDAFLQKVETSSNVNVFLMQRLSAQDKKRLGSPRSRRAFFRSRASTTPVKASLAATAAHVRTQRSGSLSHDKPDRKQNTVAWLVRNQYVRLAAFSDDLGTFHPWFHGQASRPMVEAALRPCATGTFILRLSESKYCFVLSVKDVRDVKHFMVEPNDREEFGLLGADREGHAVLREPLVTKLENLISYFQRHRLAPELMLTNGLPRESESAVAELIPDEPLYEMAIAVKRAPIKPPVFGSLA